MHDPIEMFLSWCREAEADRETTPEVAALASASRDGRPSVRMVLYRGMREGGLSFFTNYESRKGRDLTENPYAAMVFYWPRLNKQVRVEGTVERLSAEESDRYFHARPRESQATAALSRQSQILDDESMFVADLAKLDDALSRGKPIERPPNWGGFKIIPSSFEFWVRGDHRRHQRTRFEKSGDGWTMSRLYP
jgi:pyridoxamine 5'-phosphate oxidase